MSTSPLTIYVDADLAKAYEAASDEERQRMQSQLSLRLRELINGAVQRAEAVTTPDLERRRALLRRAQGIWKDRDDLPNWEELRREFDRFGTDWERS